MKSCLAPVCSRCKTSNTSDASAIRAEIQPSPTMSDAFSTPNALDPEAGFTRAPSVGQAANDLRAAAGEKAREFVNTASEQASVIKDRTLETAHHLKDVAAEKATHFKNVATEKAEAFKIAAAERAQQLRNTASEQWQERRDKAKELHITTEDYIREHPTKCVLGALGVGFLIGLIVRR